jgi:dolichyl-diphosphooligosaccharide--protein glycosyltransferase
MYFHFFHCICYIAPFAVPSLFWKRSPAKYFTLVYGLISLYFSRKMNRLVLLLAPAAAILGGIAVAGVLDWCFSHYMMMVGAAKKSVLLEDEKTDTPNGKETAAPADSTAAPTSSSKKGKKDKKKGSGPAAAASSNSITEGFAPLKEIENTARKTYDSALYLRYIAAIVGAYYLYGRLSNFWDHSQQMAVRLSNPSIILAAQTQSGQQVMLDDFREAYWWIRDNTPEDARVMSWWDYGYQISQIANRTTLADGNTWNHEHIALLGKCLVSPVKESHKIVRHLADYVLVWSTRFVGNPGDDIAKSPHMARIGGSVYKDVKAQEFYIDRQGRPSKMMYESLVYNLVLNKFDPNVPPLPPDTYEEVHTSPNRMVRVYKVLRVSQQSKDYGAQNLGYKAWLAGTHLDDAYPPALQKILSKRQDFAQLEDFNAKAKK